MIQISSIHLVFAACGIFLSAIVVMGSIIGIYVTLTNRITKLEVIVESLLVHFTKLEHKTDVLIESVNELKIQKSIIPARKPRS